MRLHQLALLAIVLAFASCETVHEAAVSTFRVVDAPHQYVRRQLGLDEQNQPQTTTTTTTTEVATYGGNPPPPPGQTYPAPPEQTYPVQPQPFQPYANQPPPPPPSQSQVESERRVTRNESQPRAPASGPTATPRMASKERVTSKEQTSKPSPTPQTASKQSSGDLPYAKPVPGKPGYVYSPFDPNGGYVDVQGFAPGQKVKDPYSGKIFLVP